MSDSASTAMPPPAIWYGRSGAQTAGSSWRWRRRHVVCAESEPVNGPQQKRGVRALGVAVPAGNDKARGRQHHPTRSSGRRRQPRRPTPSPTPAAEVCRRGRSAIPRPPDRDDVAAVPRARLLDALGGAGQAAVAQRDEEAAVDHPGLFVLGPDSSWTLLFFVPSRPAPWRGGGPWRYSCWCRLPSGGGARGTGPGCTSMNILKKGQISLALFDCVFGTQRGTHSDGSAPASHSGANEADHSTRIKDGEYRRSEPGTW